MLRGGAAESGEIGFHKRRVISRLSLLAPVEVERNFDVTAHQFLFEQAAKLHLERLGSAWQAHVQVKEAMVDALEAEGEAERFGNAPRSAGESGHGIDWRGNRCWRTHASTFPNRAGSRESYSSAPMNCRRYSFLYVGEICSSSSCEPIAVMRPCSSTAMRVARRTVE